MKVIKMYGLLYVVAKDKEWGKCCQHSHRTGEPHAESDPGWRRQLFCAADRTVVGHSGRTASVSKAWEQRVRPTKLQLQQGRGRYMSRMHVFPVHDVEISRFIGNLPLIQHASMFGCVFVTIFTGFVCCLPAAEARANLPSLYSGKISLSAVCFMCPL